MPVYKIHKYRVVCNDCKIEKIYETEDKGTLPDDWHIEEPYWPSREKHIFCQPCHKNYLDKQRANRKNK